MQVICMISVLFFIILQMSALCDKVDIRQKSFPPCKACRLFVNSFKNALENASKHGNAASEEEKSSSYSQSEFRLIQDKVCSDIQEGRNQCYSFNKQHRNAIEEWLFKYQVSEPNLFEHLCINLLKVCCLDLHYGPDCLPCFGYPDVCGNNGRCKGAGTRKGNGLCDCNSGYIGENCNQCASTYYEAYRDDKKLLCSKCHVSCTDECRKAGPSGCLSCAPGWLKEIEKGCVDINECVSSKPVCSGSEFCVNSEGSYECLKCDRSCYGCTGDGPDMCISCANGYILVDNICIDSSSEGRKQHVFLMRYLTYLGLAIATCIILQRNITIAAIIGTCVAVYIAASEYILNTPPSIVDSIVQHVPNIP